MGLLFRFRPDGYFGLRRHPAEQDPFNHHGGKETEKYQGLHLT